MNNLYQSAIIGQGLEPQRFGYDAIEPAGRRKRIVKATQSEDSILSRAGRDKLGSSAREVVRNGAIATWMVRKHLDYVTRFNFQARTKNDAVNERLEALMKQRGSRNWIDASRRHSLRRLIRMLEARKVIDGDIGIVRVASGFLRGSIQVIEEDRIRDPQKPENGETWVNGVRLNAFGQATAYGIHKRSGKSLEWDRWVPARQMYLLAYWDHTQRIDQVRGISPISASVAELQDVREGCDLSMMKLKVAQMFGLKITRQFDGLGGYGQQRVAEAEDDETESDDKYEVNLAKGPFQLDMDPGDDASFLTAATPAEESVEFLKLIIYIALKALDLPISFFDESQTNFFGSRGALLHYLRSCESKIEDLQEFLNWLTEWLVLLWVIDGELELPPDMTVEDLVWDWVPIGVPWWDPSKEVIGASNAILAALDNPQRICRAGGTDFYDNVNAIAEAVTYARSKGVRLSYDAVDANPEPVPTGDDTGDDEDNRKSEEV